MKKTISYKIACQRLAAHLGIAIAKDHSLTIGKLTWAGRPWADILGILCDLAQIRGMTAKECWEVTRFQGGSALHEGDVVFTVRDNGWKSQLVKWMLDGNDAGRKVIII
jgi:hypothetical protein